MQQAMMLRLLEDKQQVDINPSPVESAEDLTAALETGFAESGPTLIEVPL